MIKDFYAFTVRLKSIDAKLVVYSDKYDQKYGLTAVVYQGRWIKLEITGKKKR